MMDDIFADLTDEEFEYLDNFLLDRIVEGSVSPGQEEGVLDIAELDGLFTAIVSGPVIVQPSRWLPAVWGEFEPVWENDEEFEKVFSLMIRHMNGIAQSLMEQPEEFEPVFMEREVKGKTYLIVDEWCEGYQRGVTLAADAWKQAGEEMVVLLSPILAFTGSRNWAGHEHGHEEVEKLQLAITPHVREIHGYWLARRAEDEPASQPQRRTEPRVGRNDPCPCGSGKKFKNCCLH